MEITELIHNIYYVGCNDRTTELFEGLWPLPYGVTYNSYLVIGDKIALIDTVPVAQCTKFLQRIKSIIGNRQIDYLVINHMEPDHSGAISIIKSQYPDIIIIGNAKTAGMIEGYYGITDGIKVITDGESLCLGSKTLRFFLTPMVHWPETMMTLAAEDSLLFSGDAFGSFGALQGGVTDSQMNIEPYFDEIYRYYSNIVAKYGIFVQKALAKLSNVELQFVCPTHGPIWNSCIGQIIDIYSRLSKWDCERGVVVAYGSMYGNTEEIADFIGKELATAGIKNIKIYNLSKTHLSFVLRDICRYKGLIIGGPTYSNGLFPPVEALMEALKTREIKNRTIGIFGSYTWAPIVTKKLAEAFETMKIQPISSCFDMKQSISAAELEKCSILAAEMVKNL